MLIKRIVANLIDLMVLLGSIAGGVYLAGMVAEMFEEPFLLLTISMVCIIILVPIGIQSLFLIESTTIGKRFLFIKVVNRESGEDLPYMHMLVREFFVKIPSANLSTLPCFVGKPAVHDTATNSMVVNIPKKSKP